MKVQMTYELAMAAGRDVANTQMRKAGRTAWSEADYNLMVATFERLYPLELQLKTEKV